MFSWSGNMMDTLRNWNSVHNLHIMQISPRHSGTVLYFHHGFASKYPLKTIQVPKTCFVDPLTWWIHFQNHIVGLICILCKLFLVIMDITNIFLRVVHSCLACLSPHWIARMFPWSDNVVGIFIVNIVTFRYSSHHQLHSRGDCSVKLVKPPVV